MYTHVHAHMQMDTWTHRYMYTHTHKDTCTHTFAHTNKSWTHRCTQAHARTDVCTQAHAHTWTHRCLHAGTHTCMCTQTHAYTRMLTLCALVTECLCRHTCLSAPRLLHGFLPRPCLSSAPLGGASMGQPSQASDQGHHPRPRAKGSEGQPGLTGYSSSGTPQPCAGC